MAVIGVVGNVVTCIVMISNKSMHTDTMNLAISYSAIFSLYFSGHGSNVEILRKYFFFQLHQNSAALVVTFFVCSDANHNGKNFSIVPMKNGFMKVSWLYPLESNRISLYYSSSLINPIIYNLMSMKFRYKPSRYSKNYRSK